jgi:hypothetical protein
MHGKSPHGNIHERLIDRRVTITQEGSSLKLTKIIKYHQIIGSILAFRHLRTYMMRSHTVPTPANLSHSGRRKPENEEVNPACREVESQQGCNAGVAKKTQSAGS